MPGGTNEHFSTIESAPERNGSVLDKFLLD